MATLQVSGGQPAGLRAYFAADRPAAAAAGARHGAATAPAPRPAVAGGDPLVVRLGEALPDLVLSLVDRRGQVVSGSEGRSGAGPADARCLVRVGIV